MQTGEARFPLSVTPVVPGEGVTVEIDLPLEPADSIVVDLVAESVVWFASTGTAPLLLSG
jgi:hypothetical protein